MSSSGPARTGPNPSGSSTAAPHSAKDSSAYLPSLRNMFNPAVPQSILVDMAPQLLHPRSRTSVLSPHASAHALGTTSASLRNRLGWPGKEQSSNQIYIRERIEDLLRMEVPPAPFDLSPSNPATTPARLEFPSPDTAVPLIRGFHATAPSASLARTERRKQRAGLGEKALGLEGPLGLKAKVDQARGMLGGPEEGEEGLSIGRKAGVKKVRKKGRKGLDDGPAVEQSVDELEKEASAVEDDMANVAVRRVSPAAARGSHLAAVLTAHTSYLQAVLNGQIGEVEQKIAELDAIRDGMKRGLLGLREEELELEDERKLAEQSGTLIGASQD